MRVLVCLCALLAWGCAEKVDPATPEGALHQLRDALMKKDAAAVLALSSKATHDKLAELHTLIKEQKTAIEERYPEEHRAPARTAFASGVLEAEDSAALFAALIAERLKELKATEGLKYGLTALGAPTITGTHATVPSHSGETIEMVFEDDKWRVTSFERSIEHNLSRIKLNQQTLAENLKVFDEMKRQERAKKAKAAAAARAADTEKAAGGR